jgi:hypothetical protein
MIVKALGAAAGATLLAWGSAEAQAVQSRYSTLQTQTCKRLAQSGDETDWSQHLCPGIAGYRLRLDYADARESVTVLAPGGGAHDLRLWETVSSGFSTIKPTVEWRGRPVRGLLRPYALILRYSAHEKPAEPPRATSYLAVARLAPGPVCVVGIVPPGRQQNEAARRVADASAGASCLGPR